MSGIPDWKTPEDDSIWVGVILIVVLWVCGVLAFLALAPAAAFAQSYVSLGDSYVSGPGILPPAEGAPLDCTQSARNYPHLTAKALGLSLRDVSCGGATTADLTTEAQFPDQPPQFDALASSTEVVSVGIGGNDNNLFVGTLATCGAEISRSRSGPPARTLMATGSPKR